MSFGEVKFIKPKKSLLQSKIKGYYIHRSEDPSFYTKLTFFQNITTTISTYRNTSTSSEGRHRIQRHKESSGFTVLLAGLVDRYQEVEFFGPLDRVAIVFHPCGLNHFIKEPLGDFLEKDYSYFNHFGENLDSVLASVYDQSDLDSKRDMLDNYFAERYTAFQEPELLMAVERLINTGGLIKVNVLAKELEISRRTLLRKFKKHLGYTIEDYVSVIKFRKALLNYQRLGDQEKIGRIAYESNYYDQADFNHAFKFRSGMTPKELFKELEIVDGTLFWKS